MITVTCGAKNTASNANPKLKGTTQMKNARLPDGRVEVFELDRSTEMIAPQTKQQKAVHRLDIPLLGHFTCNDRAIKAQVEGAILGGAWTAEEVTKLLQSFES